MPEHIVSEHILQRVDVSAGYGPTHVIQNLNLTVTKGERIAVIGRNGAGKTTLLATIMGLTRLQGPAAPAGAGHHRAGAPSAGG